MKFCSKAVILDVFHNTMYRNMLVSLKERDRILRLGQAVLELSDSLKQAAGRSHLVACAANLDLFGSTGWLTLLASSIFSS